MKIMFVLFLVNWKRGLMENKVQICCGMNFIAGSKWMLGRGPENSNSVILTGFASPDSLGAWEGSRPWPQLQGDMPWDTLSAE